MMTMKMINKVLVNFHLVIFNVMKRNSKRRTAFHIL